MDAFYVFDGFQWLSDDEKTWTSNFGDAAEFASAELAKDIGAREGDEHTIYVLGLLSF